MSKRKIGELHIGENAQVDDIETMIDYGLETAVGITLESNEDGTYDIFIEDSEEQSSAGSVSKSGP